MAYAPPVTLHNYTNTHAAYSVERPLAVDEARASVFGRPAVPLVVAATGQGHDFRLDVTRPTRFYASDPIFRVRTRYTASVDATLKQNEGRSPCFKRTSGF